MVAEWKYIPNTRDGYVSVSGDVHQGDHILEPYRHPVNGFRVVDLNVETNTYDYETGGWRLESERVYVWQLVKEAFFFSWPSESSLHFVDGDSWNCSVDNIRAWSNRHDRIVRVREEEWGFIFDKRLRGQVEIVETGQVFEGPAEAARAIGGTRSGVSRVLSGDLERHHGFHFRWN